MRTHEIERVRAGAEEDAVHDDAVHDDAEVAGALADPGRARRLAVEAWEALFRAQVAVMRRLEADDIWSELSIREYDVLYQLARSPEKALRLRDLNGHILLTQPSLSRMVERLAARGLVARESVPDDARGLRVRLTPAGERLRREVGRRHAATIHARVGGALAEDDLRTLRRVCERLLVAQQDPPAGRTTTPGVTGHATTPGADPARETP